MARKKKEEETIKEKVIKKGTGQITTKEGAERRPDAPQFEPLPPPEKKKFVFRGKELTSEEFDTAKRLTGGRGAAPRSIRTPGIITPAVTEAIGQPLPEDVRREAFQEETGAGVLKEELQEKIITPPDLAPIPVSEVTSEMAKGVLKSRVFQPFGISGVGASAELLKNPEKELKRTGIELAAGAGIALSTLGLGFLANTISKAAITKGVIGVKGSATLLGGATTALSLFVVGPGIFDFRGDEMETYRGQLQRMVEDGERIEAAVRNGFPNTDSIELLSTMSQEVNTAERRIKELGNNNIKYRVSKEYLLDTTKVRSSREALLRRVLAVENIAATGQASFKPEELLFISKQFENPNR